MQCIPHNYPILIKLRLEKIISWMKRNYEKKNLVCWLLILKKQECYQNVCLICTNRCSGCGKFEDEKKENRKQKTKVSF